MKSSRLQTLDYVVKYLCWARYLETLQEWTYEQKITKVVGIGL